MLRVDEDCLRFPSTSKTCRIVMFYGCWAIRFSNCQDVSGMFRKSRVCPQRDSLS